MSVASVFYAPLLFLKAAPPALIHRAIERRRVLPPLLFLLIACFPLLELSATYGAVAASLNAELALEQHWERLKKLDPWAVFTRAAPPFLTLWLACEVAAYGVARMVSRPRPMIREAFLYLSGLGVTYFSLGAVVILAAIGADSQTLFGSPLFVRLSRPLALLCWAVPLLLSIGFGVYIARRMRRRGMLPSGRALGPAFVAVSAAIPLFALCVGLLAGVSEEAVHGAQSSLSLTSGLTRGEDKLRLVLMTDASRCTVAGGDLVCTVVIRTRERYDVVVDDILVAALMIEEAVPAKNMPRPAPAPLQVIDVKPRVGNGDTLRLPAGKAFPLSLRMSLRDLCAQLGAGGQATDGKWRLRLSLSGHAMQEGVSGLPRRGFEAYRLVTEVLSEDVLAQSRDACQASAPATR